MHLSRQRAVPRLARRRATPVSVLASNLSTLLGPPAQPPRDRPSGLRLATRQDVRVGINFNQVPQPKQKNGPAVMRDLGGAGAKAIADCRQRGIPDLLCHFQFLAAVGRKLLDGSYALLRSQISRSKLRGPLGPARACGPARPAAVDPGRRGPEGLALSVLPASLALLPALRAVPRRAGPPSAATPHASRAPHAAAGRPGPGRSPAAGPEGARRRPPGARLDRVLRLAVRAAPVRAGTAPRPTPPTLCPARARGRCCPAPSDRRGPAALPQGPAPAAPGGRRARVLPAGAHRPPLSGSLR